MGVYHHCFEVNEVLEYLGGGKFVENCFILDFIYSLVFSFYFSSVMIKGESRNKLCFFLRCSEWSV